MSRLLPSRGTRWLLLVLACLAAISLFLLATASANTELFARRYDLLPVLNGALVVLLMLLVGVQLCNCDATSRTGCSAPGSHSASCSCSLVAVLPGALVHAVSFSSGPQHGKLVRRSRRPRSKGLNLGRGARLPLEGNVEQGGPDRARLERPGHRQRHREADPREAGGHETALFTTAGSVIAVGGVSARRRRRAARP
jgi:hypothetical protein